MLKLAYLSFNVLKYVPNKNLNLTRCMAVWEKDIKPGRIPITEESRVAAAKKYGILPQDYQPLDADYCAGDYPQIKDTAFLEKDPYQEYDYPDYRINYNEPIYHNLPSVNHLYQPDWYLTHKYNKNRNKLAFMSLFLPLILVYLIIQLIKPYEYGKPYMPQQMAFTDEKHYTFDIVE